MADEIKLDGLAELKRTLEALPERLGDRVAVGALRSGARVIRKAAIDKAPVLKAPNKYRKPGTLRKAIKIAKSKRDKFGVYIGMRKLSKAKGQKPGAKNPDDPFYWFFVEFGTKHMPAQPFLRPAFEEKKLAAIAAFSAYARKRVVKEAEKLAREKGSNTGGR